jgi:hypothetical protein
MISIKLPSEGDVSTIVQALRVTGQHHLAGYIVQQVEQQRLIIDDAKLVREVE